MAKKKAQRKKLTPAQLEELRPYEKNMQTAIRSDWSRGLGSRGIDTMARIRGEVTGETYVNRSCPVCVLELVRTVGRWYFEDLAAVEGKEGEGKA